MSRTISEVAAEAGVSTDALRYYERLGLLAPPRRGANRYRLYDEEALPRVAFVRSAQRAGLRLSDIKELLEIRDRGTCPCGHTALVVERRVAEVDAELARLHAMRHELVALGERNQACVDPAGELWWCASAPATEGGEPTSPVRTAAATAAARRAVAAATEPLSH